MTWRHRKLTALCLFGLALDVTTAAGAEYRLEAFGGVPVNAETPLTITQDGEPDIELDARFDSRPLEPSIYYAYRLSRWSGSEGWGVDFVHHKLHLSNLPPEVENFSITHGFNMISVARLWNREQALISLGAGVVVGHAESVVRGKRLSESDGLFGRGYYVTGPLAYAGVGRSARWSRAILGLETRASAAYVSVPVEAGRARFWSVTFHMLLGIGIAI